VLQRRFKVWTIDYNPLPPRFSLGVKVPKKKLRDPKGNLDKLLTITLVTLPKFPLGSHNLCLGTFTSSENIGGNILALLLHIILVTPVIN
jgi:hypothetical protein